MSNSSCPAIYVTKLWLCSYIIHRTIAFEAMDGDGASGPVTAVSVTFNRICSILRDESGNNLQILDVPRFYQNYSRIELCTGIEIRRTQIVNSLEITDLQFMRNIRVSNNNINWLLI